MRIINLTGFTIRDVITDNEFPPSDEIARVNIDVSSEVPIEGMPVRQESYKKLEGLPEPQEGTIYIVSREFEHLVVRPDVYTYDTIISYDVDSSVMIIQGLKKTHVFDLEFLN